MAQHGQPWTTTPIRIRPARVSQIPAGHWFQSSSRFPLGDEYFQGRTRQRSRRDKKEKKRKRKGGPGACADEAAGLVVTYPSVRCVRARGRRTRRNTKFTLARALGSEAASSVARRAPARFTHKQPRLARFLPGPRGPARQRRHRMRLTRPDRRLVSRFVYQHGHRRGSPLPRLLARPPGPRLLDRAGPSQHDWMPWAVPGAVRDVRLDGGPRPHRADLGGPVHQSQGKATEAAGAFPRRIPLPSPVGNVCCSGKRPEAYTLLFLCLLLTFQVSFLGPAP